MKRWLLPVGLAVFVVLGTSGCASDVCITRINNLRSQEGLPALAYPSADQQSCTNDDVQVNYSQNAPHFQSCGMAQNTCPGGYATTTSVLDDCVNSMYVDEKECYENDDPNLCYYGNGPTGCVCGHYVNMTDKKNMGYKTVACGWHQTPAGDWWLVMNFFK